MPSRAIVLFTCVFTLHFTASDGTCREDLKSCITHLSNNMEGELTDRTLAGFNNTCRLLDHAISCVRRYARACISKPGQRAKFYETHRVDSATNIFQAMCSEVSPARKAYEIDDECVNTVWTENADCKRQLLKVIGKPSLDWLKTDAKICCAINQFATCTTTRAYTKCGPESAMQLMEGLNILQSECNNHHKNGSLTCQSPSSNEQMDCRIHEIITPCQQDFPNILKNGAISMLPKDMNKHCRLLNNTVHCVKEKLEECYNDPAIKVEHSPIFLTGVLANLTTTTCTKDSRGKTAYDQYRKCLTSLDKELQSCMDPYLKLPNNSQTTFQCCTIRKMTKCVVAQAESNCGAEAAEYIRSSVTILQGPEFKLWEMCNTKNMQSKGCDDTSSGYTPMLSNAIVIVLAFVFAL